MKKLMITALGCALVSGSFAGSAGFQLSLVPDVAIQDRTTEIRGLSLGIYNENPGKQWQIGLVNGATGDSAGFQSFIPFVFFPAIYNYTENYTGFSLGLVNYSSGEYTGLQWGAVNYANQLTGVQLGLANIGKQIDGGFQWGLVNYAETAQNLFQLGFVNIIADNTWFSDFPSDLATGFVFVNWTFGE